MAKLYAVKMIADGMEIRIVDEQRRRNFYTTREEAEAEADEQRQIAAPTVEIIIQELDIED